MGVSSLSKLATAAYHFVTVKKADPKGRYTYEKAPGKFILLDGKAKEHAIHVEDLKNQRTRWRNVYNLCSTIVGVGLSFRAWSTQSYLPLVIWTLLMTLGHNSSCGESWRATIRSLQRAMWPFLYTFKTNHPPHRLNQKRAKGTKR